MEYQTRSTNARPEQQTGRHYFMNHKGNSILYLDFSNLPLEVKPRTLQYIGEAKKIVGTQIPGSLLLIANVSDSAFDREIAGALQDLVSHNKPFIKRSAIIGMKGLQLALFHALNRLTGRKMVARRDLESAKDWIVSEPD